MTTEGFEAIVDKEYLGRIIVIGKSTAGEEVVAYAVTGRSFPSRARVLYRKKDGITKTFPTNLKAQIDPEADELSEEAKQEILATGGNPALLIYNALVKSDGAIVVSNGAQTDLIASIARGNLVNKPAPPGCLLQDSFSHPYTVGGVDVTSYEPDAPNFTPRISGLIKAEGAALAIVRNPDGKAGSEPKRDYTDFPLVRGQGKLISTYTGRNVPKGVVIPSFQGEPLDVRIFGVTPHEVARALYEALGPKQPGEGIVSPGDDFRVGVVAMFYNREFSHSSIHVINRGDGK